MNSGGPPPEPPTPEVVMNDLPRIVLRSDRTSVSIAPHIVSSDVSQTPSSMKRSICHEPFNPALCASPVADADLMSTFNSKAPESSPVADSNQEQLGVEMPCKHTIHEECIMPWLKMKSSCLVCRYVLNFNHVRMLIFPCLEHPFFLNQTLLTPIMTPTTAVLVLVLVLVLARDHPQVLQRERHRTTQDMWTKRTSHRLSRVGGMSLIEGRDGMEMG